MTASPFLLDRKPGTMVFGADFYSAAVPRSHDPEETLVRLRRRILDGPGHLDVSVRQAAFGDDLGTLSSEVAGYVSKVHRHAYEVTDRDVVSLRESGLSEDEIFELTISAAVGAGVRRLDMARAAREASES